MSGGFTCSYGILPLSGSGADAGFNTEAIAKQGKCRNKSDGSDWRRLYPSSHSFSGKGRSKTGLHSRFCRCGISYGSSRNFIGAYSKGKKIAAEIEKEEIQEEKLAGEAIAENTKELPKPVKKSLYMILLSIFFWFAAYNAVTTAFSRYAVKVWGLEGGGFADCLMVATVAAIFSYIPIGMISEKFGRKKCIQGGLLLLLISYLSAAFFPVYHPAINIGFILIGIGWASISVNSLPMVVEICSLGDVGKYTGVYYTFSMAAQIFTPIFSGFLMQHISYRVLFPYACVFTILAMITMCMVKHGDSKPQAKKKVWEHFDVED